jgi:hypothetical protein
VTRKRPLLVSAAGWVLIASGVTGLASHIGEFATVDKLDYGLVSLVRALAIVAGGFMLRGSNWARWLAMLWIASHVIISAFHPIRELAIHILVFAVFAWVLFRPDAASYFRRAERP